MDDSNMNILPSDKYYFEYKIMELTFGNENIFDGLRKSLHFIAMYTASSDAVLYQKDINKYFNVVSFSASSKTNDFSSITSILNRIEKPLLTRDYIDFDVQISRDISHVVYIKIMVNADMYVLALPNINKKDNILELSNVLKKNLSIIIKKIKQYEQMVYDANLDLLTGVNNRNLYEKDAKILDNVNCPYSYALFDLFRLKYVNDNYGHTVGDMYIIKTAEILKKYFPQYRYITDNDEIKKINTGSMIYRIGGDEFALIDKFNSIGFINNQSLLIKQEVEDIDLGVKDKVQLGINYGISYHNMADSLKDVSIKADAMLRDDKTKMYQKLGIDRRR